MSFLHFWMKQLNQKIVPFLKVPQLVASLILLLIVITYYKSSGYVFIYFSTYLMLVACKIYILWKMEIQRVNHIFISKRSIRFMHRFSKNNWLIMHKQFT